jgi:hypothetical protein
MSLFYIYIFIIIFFGFVMSGVRMYFYILSVRKANLESVYEKIKEWYGLISTKGSTQAVSEVESAIDKLFEKKIIKTALVHFDKKFITEFLASDNIPHDQDEAEIKFRDLTRISLKKSEQSLKLISFAVGHKFTYENYSLMNYWLILKGNRNLYMLRKPDAQGRNYGIDDVDEPFKVLEYYFEKYKKKVKK